MNQDQHAAQDNAFATSYTMRNQMTRPVWSFWATIGFGIILWLALTVSDLFVTTIATIYHIIHNPQSDPYMYAYSLYTNGFILSLSILLRAPITILLVFLFVFLKKGASIKDYLTLHPVPIRVLLVWLGITILLSPILDGLTMLFDRPIIPEFWIKVFNSAGFLPLLLVSVVIVAPVVEEVFFRGFLFRGIEQSKVGPIGAVLITTTIWTLIHFQYDWFEMMLVFILGILFGVARIRTNSIYTTIAMHSLVNLISAIEMAIIVQRYGNIG